MPLMILLSCSFGLSSEDSGTTGRYPHTGPARSLEGGIDMGPKPLTDAERLVNFWTRVNKDTPTGCWEWIAGKDWDGYGIFFWHGKHARVHRLSYELALGEPIPNRLWVLHECDNPPCVRPDHLYLGNATDNARDRESRGRSANRWGEANPGAILTDAIVLDMRKRYFELGEPARSIYTSLGLNRWNFFEAVSGDSWPDAGGPTRKTHTRPGKQTWRISSEVGEQIRALYGTKPNRELCDELGVSPASLYRIAHGKPRAKC